MTPRSPSRILARHCDRYVVTAASRLHAAGMSDFRSRCILRRTNEPVRPADRDSDIGTWVARGPASLARPRFPDCRCGRPPQAHPADHRVPEEQRDLRSIGPSPVSTVASNSSIRRPIRSITPRRVSPPTRSGARAAAPAVGRPAMGATTSATSAARAATSGASSAPIASTSRWSARRAATRRRSRSGPGWTARCTARTASGRCGPTDGVAGRVGLRRSQSGSSGPARSARGHPGRYPAHPASAADPGHPGHPRPIPALARVWNITRFQSEAERRSDRRNLVLLRRLEHPWCSKGRSSRS